MQMYNPPHPGPILRESLENIPATVTEFAAHIGVSRVTLSRVLNAHAGITMDISIRIGQAFGQAPDLWFKVQAAHDFWQASHVKRPKVKRLKIVATESIEPEWPRHRAKRGMRAKGGGQRGTRTPDILLVRQAL